ncbi:hypothetical protein KOI35_24710 [Actinoplanes bogorensis]|uniref:Uncharacterized protein n=1 Tax=Paractinoplanes bogorensis TaxID=1610840 RepID=A0ABS5YTC9_9ACTN|nr:hypothetical protein [Actinoplanes bogorensis]MBU2666715.1 hypothetical protein [Actinoplanes bogorensis]
MNGRRARGSGSGTGHSADHRGSGGSPGRTWAARPGSTAGVGAGQVDVATRSLAALTPAAARGAGRGLARLALRLTGNGLSPGQLSILARNLVRVVLRHARGALGARELAVLARGGPGRTAACGSVDVR